MFTKLAGNIVSGVISMVALYVVAKVSYNVGVNMTKMDHEYRAVAQKTALMNAEMHKIKEASKELQNISEDYGTSVSTPDEMGLTVVDAPQKKNILSKLIGFIGGKKMAVLQNIVQSPETHKLEASINGDAVDIRIQKRCVV